MSPRRILWPTDLQPADAPALETALGFCGDGADLVVLHVVRDPARELYDDDASEGADHTAWAFWKVAREEAEDRLRRSVGDQMGGFERVRYRAALGDPADRILEVVAEESIDLVVLAGRPRKSLVFGTQLGSVAYRLVRELSCDVLVVK